MENNMVMVNTNATGVWGRNAAARQQLVRELVEQAGVIVNRKQVLAFIESTGRTVNDVSWLLNGKQFRASRGQYTLQPLLAGDGASTSEPTTASNVA
jgi:hypothetical protein